MTDGRTVERTARQTDWRTDGQTDTHSTELRKYVSPCYWGDVIHDVKRCNSDSVRHVCAPGKGLKVTDNRAVRLSLIIS